MTSRSDRSPTSAEHALADLYRSSWGRLLALLVARTRRLDLAEDALAEAFARASERWVHDGIPANGEAWLYTAAHRLVLGRLRTEAVAGRKVPLLAIRGPAGIDGLDAAHEGEQLPDERLQLVLLCCHPALEPAARSALALRLVIGTPTAEIARLFLVPTPTMAARLTRAKKKIVAAGIPLGLPAGDELAGRLESLARTVYLAFTAGYAPGHGDDLLRSDLAGEAVALARVLLELRPHDAVTRSLLALLALQHARRDARVADGRLVLLSEQNRTVWRSDEIAMARRVLPRDVTAGSYAEELRLQALIAEQHSIAPNAAATDWRTIHVLYELLERHTGSPVVRLNRAVALAETEGPAAGLALLTGLERAIGGNHRLHAVRADLARRAGLLAAARESYRLAIDHCDNGAERAFLAERLAQVSSDGESTGA